jgi:hypothetical protein
MSSLSRSMSERADARLRVLAMAIVVATTSVMAIASSATGSAVEPAGAGGMTILQQAAPGEPIPLTPLTGLTSLEATVTMEVDGVVDGEATQGDLTARLTSTDEPAQRIDVTGSLLGDIVAQIGGSAVKLFRPKMVSGFAVPEGTYVVLDALVDVCVKPQGSEATEALQQLSPQALMDILTSSDVARGTFVGDEVLNGMPVRHYAIDGAEFLAAAQGSSDPNVSLFARSLESATDADLYVAAEGGYPVAYRGGFAGRFEPLKFEGDLTVQIDLTGVNGDAEVVLPGSCDRAIPA